MKKVLHLLLLVFMMTSMHALQGQNIPVNSPAGINGKLKVIGTKLCNQYDKPIQLRGMSTHGLQWFYDDCYSNSKTAAFDALKNWGADILRISMYVQEDGYETDPTGFTNKVKALIDIASARGMYVLVDFHQLDPGDPNFNTARAKTFFTAIASTYKDYPNIIYDICNEPNGDNVSWSVIKTYADQVIPTIRAIDNDAVITVGTDGWATFGFSRTGSATTYKDVVNNKLNYPNVMYSFHFYADSHRDSYLAVLDAVSNELPVFVSEFGFQNSAGEGANNRAMSDKYITLMRNKKISWCNWNYSDDSRSGAVWKSGTCSSNNWSDANLKEAGLWAKEYISSPADDFPTGSINQAPNINLTAPANNTNFTAPASITISANATDTDGTISKVEFYNGTTLLNSDATAPYSFVWTNVGTGTYSITAKATDNAGATKTSTAVNVTVNNASDTQAPAVNITAPSNNATYNAPASITISANASDNVGVTKVEFYNGTTLLNSDATAPYSFAWTNVAAGTYSITAKAFDAAGNNTTSAAITVTVNTVTVTQSPYGGTAANIPGTVQAENYDLGGQAIAFNDATTANEGAAYRTDAVDIEAVSGGGFNVGWTAAGEWLEYTVNVTAGTYKIDARVAATATAKSFRIEMDGATVATFNVPNTTGWQTWQTITVNNVALTAGQKVMRVYCITDGFNIDNLIFTSVSNPPVNIAPTVSLTAPTNNATLTAPTSITISANAADADGTISKIEFFNGTTLLNSDATAPYSFAWTNVTTGTYNITAKATDNLGATTTTAAVSVTVTSTADTQAPTVSLTSPANGATYNAAASINIAANASDNVGVTKVEFYNGTTLLTSDATAPYAFTWTNVAAGNYSITAKAYDASGNTKTSTAVSVTVNTVTTGGCTGIAQYVENGGYVAGSKVQNAGSQYECKPYPYSGWCNGAAWAYGAGTGAYWTDAWTLVGSCNARIANDNARGTVNDNLLTNAPNPFTTNTDIEVNVAESGEVSLVVFDKEGKLVATISEGTLSAGSHRFNFNTSLLNPGMYIVKCTTSNGVITRKIVKM